MNKWIQWRQKHDLASLIYWESDLLVVSDKGDIKRINDLISKKLGGNKILSRGPKCKGEVLSYKCKTEECDFEIKWGLIGLQKREGPQWYLYSFKPHTLGCVPTTKEIKCTGDKNDTCPYSVDQVAQMIEDILLHNPKLQNHTLAAHLKAIVRAKGDHTSFQGGHDRFPVSCAVLPLQSLSLTRCQNSCIIYHKTLIIIAGI